jgi:hypothetical protein
MQGIYRWVLINTLIAIASFSINSYCFFFAITA